MASLKEIKGRIASVEGTHKITSAMKMVASAKLHKAQVAIENMHPYDRRLHETMVHLITMLQQGLHKGPSSFSLPLCEDRAEVKRVAVVAVASNTSLCGGYNSNVLRRLCRLFEDYSSLGADNIDCYVIGKKLDQSLSKTSDMCHLIRDYVEAGDHPSYATAETLAKHLRNDFLAGRIDRVELVYTHFKSTASQQVMHENYLPIVLGTENSTNVSASSEGYVVEPTHYIVEPSIEEVLRSILPDVLSMKLYTMLLDAQAAEHAARTIAMQTATDNANDLLGELRIMYNKGRQQAITAELLDIVGGSMK